MDTQATGEQVDDMVDAARVVQLSDTHLSRDAGTPAEWQATHAWLTADPPDLIVHTGDIVLFDPDDTADRSFARGLVDELLDVVRSPFVAVPGNHDVGFYDESGVRDRDRRIDAFRETWGDDRFSLDLAGWRLVGANSYLLGDAEHDAWLARHVDVGLPAIVFIHQPLDEPTDGWEMPAAARRALKQATEGADVRVIATGHRHRHRLVGRGVWCPSLTIRGEDWDDSHESDPETGFIEHRLGRDGTHRHRVVRPWAR